MHHLYFTAFQRYHPITRVQPCNPKLMSCDCSSFRSGEKMKYFKNVVNTKLGADTEAISPQDLIRQVAAFRSTLLLNTASCRV